MIRSAKRCFPTRKKRIGRLAPLAGGLILLLQLSLGAQEIMTLDKALEFAFRNSPNIKEAAYRLQTSGENLKAQQAGLKSQFSLTLNPFNLSDTKTFSELTSSYNTQSITRTAASFSIRQPIKWTDGTLTVTDSFNWQESSSSFVGGTKAGTYNNSLFLKLSQPLFTYNRTQMQIEELELALENSRLNYGLQKLSIERQVTQQFLNLYYSRESVKIAQDEFKNADEQLKIIESKVQAGIAARGELYQADLTRLSSQAALENKQIQYENAMDSFKILIGMSLDPEIEIVTDIRKQIVEVDLPKAIAHGLASRMELRQRDISIQTALNDLIQAAAQNEFKAQVDLTLGLTGVNRSFQDIYGSPNVDRVVALTLNIPVFDWGQKKHVVAATQAQVDTQRLSLEEQRNQIQLDIRQAYRNLLNQKRQIEIAEQNTRNAQLTYEINLERYKSGDLSSKDMQFYQQQLSTQKLNEVSALINYKLALLDIKIRSLWDFGKNVSIVEKI
ncbi:MAG: TolC family protein [Candidatus Aminicenantes bacterium]|nr:TolC family protein [Candidatus Aminicenantes bacterium]